VVKNLTTYLEFQKQGEKDFAILEDNILTIYVFDEDLQDAKEFIYEVRPINKDQGK
jgi:hypothetical protein